MESPEEDLSDNNKKIIYDLKVLIRSITLDNPILNAITVLAYYNYSRNNKKSTRFLESLNNFVLASNILTPTPKPPLLLENILKRYSSNLKEIVAYEIAESFQDYFGIDSILADEEIQFELNNFFMKDKFYLTWTKLFLPHWRKEDMEDLQRIKEQLINKLSMLENEGINRNSLLESIERLSGILNGGYFFEEINFKTGEVKEFTETLILHKKL